MTERLFQLRADAMKFTFTVRKTTTHIFMWTRFTFPERTADGLCVIRKTGDGLMLCGNGRKTQGGETGINEGRKTGTNKADSQ